MDTFGCDFVDIVDSPRIRELRAALERGERRLAELNARMEARRQAGREQDRELRRLTKNLRANPLDEEAMREMNAYIRQMMIGIASDPKGMAESLDRIDGEASR